MRELLTSDRAEVIPEGQGPAVNDEDLVSAVLARPGAARRRTYYVLTATARQIAPSHPGMPNGLTPQNR
ncbi:hypothetical protein NKH18_09785 [Streptomyces sp. M10(2022)]